MKIGIDARLYGIKDRGIGRYTEKLIEYLEKLSARGGSALGGDSQNEYFIFLRQDGFNKYQPQNKNFHKVLADYRPYSWQEQILFPCQLKKYKLDLVHFTHFNAPIFYGRPFIVTIHDLIITRFPESRRKSTILPLPLYYLKLFFYNLVLKNALFRSKKIIAVSEATRKEIIELFSARGGSASGGKINPVKIEVIYEGVDTIKIPNSQFLIPNSYALYVGAAYPHKNLERLLIAFNRFIISAQGGSANTKDYKNKNGGHNSKFANLKLVLVGKKDYFYQRTKHLAEKLNLANNVVFAGEVSDNELASYYQHALFFIFPSLAEGFGLPALEALNYGLPVAASSVSSLPEILGDAAYYFDPHNIDEIAKAIETMATNDKLRHELKEKATTQIKKFSWQKTAEETLKIYHRLIKS